MCIPTCQLHPTCSSRAKWNRINQVVEQTLEKITMAEMARPLGADEQLVHIDVTPHAMRTWPTAPRRRWRDDHATPHVLKEETHG